LKIFRSEVKVFYNKNVAEQGPGLPLVVDKAFNYCVGGRVPVDAKVRDFQVLEQVL
jgi:hypothetical protein